MCRPLGMHSNHWSQPTIHSFPLAYKILQPLFFLLTSFLFQPHSTASLLLYFFSSPIVFGHT